MITFSKTSLIYRLLTFYGGYHRFDLEACRDFCTLVKMSLKGIRNIIFGLFAFTIVFSAFLAPAFSWIVMLLAGMALDSPDIITSLTIMTLIIIFILFAIVIFKAFDWYYDYTYEKRIARKMDKRESKFAALVNSLKGKYCTLVKFEDET